MGLRFMYKLKSNTSYIETLKYTDDRENQNYQENERSIKHKGVYLRRQEQRYMEEQKEMNQTQPPCLVNNILFCYEGDKHTGNESEKKAALSTTQRETQSSIHKYIRLSIGKSKNT